MFGRVRVAGWGEGWLRGSEWPSCGVRWTENLRTHGQKRPLPTKKAYPPSNKDLDFLVQNRFYYWRGGIR